MDVRRAAASLVVLALATTGPAAAAATGDDAVGRNPFAGDTRWVAYQTWRDGHEGIWLVHPDGSGDHEIDFGLPVTMQLPDWSPDGTRLVVTSRGGEHEPLYEYELATGEVTQPFACEGDCLGDDEPAYSPDGRRISFVRAFLPFTDAGPADCSLWVGDRATGETHRLTSNGSCDREYYPHWSPDGRYLTYHRELAGRDGSVTTAVYVVDADGTHERRLTDPSMVAGSPDWSPDGQWIVFSTYPLNVFQGGGDSQLFRMRPDGSGVQQLTHFRSVRGTQPRYSRDGRWILFTAVRLRQRSIWAVPADGGTPVVVAQRERIYTHPTLQPH